VSSYVPAEQGSVRCKKGMRLFPFNEALAFEIFLEGGRSFSEYSSTKGSSPMSKMRDYRPHHLNTCMRADIVSSLACSLPPLE